MSRADVGGDRLDDLELADEVLHTDLLHFVSVLLLDRVPPDALARNLAHPSLRSRSRSTP